MIKVIFYTNVLVIIIAFFEMMRMAIFQKSWSILPDGTLADNIDAGTYNVAVCGRVWRSVIKKIRIYIYVSSDNTIDAHVHSFPSTGMANYRVFTKLATFRLNAPEKLKVRVENINTEDIMASKSLLKRLLFKQRNIPLEIIITPKFNYIKFIVLVILNISSCFLLAIQLQRYIAS